MLRIILGVIAGYIVMTLALFIMFSILYTVLGTSGSFQPDSYFVSTVWVVAGLAVFFVGAVLAGLVCSMIAKNPKAGFWMGIVILVLGLVAAFAQMAQIPADTSRDVAEVAMMDAMSLAQQPVWALFLNPVLGLFGAIAGSKLAKDRD